MAALCTKPLVGRPPGGHLEVLRWLKETGVVFRGKESYVAAARGHLEVLMRLHDEGEPPAAPGAFTEAAGGGHLEVLKWLHTTRGCVGDEETCAGAAQGGHLEVLKWLRENGCGWDAETFWRAAEAGDLQMLMWLSEHQCPWDSSTWATNSAAKKGHLEVLKWLRDAHSCPWDEETSGFAASTGNVEMLK